MVNGVVDVLQDFTIVARAIQLCQNVGQLTCRRRGIVMGEYGQTIVIDSLLEKRAGLQEFVLIIMIGSVCQHLLAFEQ